MPHRILIVNDDGLSSPGISILARLAKTLGSCVCVAPDRNQSGSSQSLSLDRPLSFTSVAAEIPSWKVNGTPADCVFLALSGAIPGLTTALGGAPDLVLSGINQGENLGDDVLYSGTVGAASVAALWRCPAVAISAPKNAAIIDLSAAAALELIKYGLLNQASLWNINLPLRPHRGVTLTWQGLRSPAGEPTPNPEGMSSVWLGSFGDGIPEPGNDFFAVANDLISLTPLTTSRCDLPALQQARRWLQEMAL
jgi:5'-nucleotidase